MWILVCFAIYSSALPALEFQQITKEDGLSHNNVECILQDRNGFMWFGTRNGLCRFDGYDFKIYLKNSDPGSISGNRILSMAEDQDGNIWIGTYQNGVSKFDARTNMFERYDSIGNIGNQVYSVSVLSDNTVCLGTNYGLTLYYPEQDSFYTYTPNTGQGLNSFMVSDVIETVKGEVYVATWEADIQRFNRESNRFESIAYQQGNRAVSNYRKRLLDDENGNLWIAANIHGLFKYNIQSGDVKFYFEGDNELNTDVLNGDMVRAPDGKIWLATDGGGINVFNPENETFDYLTHDGLRENSLPSNNIYTLFIDRSNRFWIGTFKSGVALYDPQQHRFKNSQLPDNIFSFFKDKSVLSVFEDSRENIWIGTDGYGLHKITDFNKLTSYYTEENNINSISSNVITSITEDAEGKILIGTYTGGLCVFDPASDTFTRHLPESNNNQKIHSDNVWTLLSDSEGNNWLGLLGNGVDLYYPKTNVFKNVGPYSNELIKVGHPNVMALLEDADGDIWFGTEGDGIYIYDKQAGKMLRLDTQPKSTVCREGVIKDFYQDGNGEIWIATEGSGLFKYNKADKSLKQFTTEDGLPGMITMGIQEDRTGNIWVSTYDGLARYDKKNNVFTAFYSYDGLTSNEFNAEAFIKLNNGYFILGSVAGIDVFDPVSISFNQNIPPLFFTKLTILNQEITPNQTSGKKRYLEEDILYTKELTLNYSDKIFAIEFVALNYTQPQKCQYKYMLEGFDNDWIFTSPNRRFATYSNLHEGFYTFKVQASNNDGRWGNNQIELKIRVLPPFWKTSWFIALALVLVLGILFAAYRYRVNLLKNRFLQEKASKEKQIIELEKQNVEKELEKLTYYSVYRKRILVNYKIRLQSLSLKAKESVKRGLEVVIGEIDKELTDDKDWKYLEPRLDNLYNDFITKLRERHPDLTLSEIKIASYVRMNLTSKDISEFMNKTIRAVENDRYRLRKKLKLDSNESLQTYLLNL